MAEAQGDTMQLMAGLLTHMRQIVGDGACYAMLHYGATEEGKRFGSGLAQADLPKVLERLDQLLLHKTEVLQDDGATVTLRVRSSAFHEASHRAMQGVILGLVEGALTASRAGRFKGVLAAREGDLLIELKREG